MAISKNPIFANGIWGPYYSAMVPGMWLNEGGQSATGKLLDHIIETHPATKGISQKLADMLVLPFIQPCVSEETVEHFQAHPKVPHQRLGKVSQEEQVRLGGLFDP